MSQSPSKRQRVSADSYVPRGSHHQDAMSVPNPTTPPRRASYLSPTKASLARSHPNLLSKSPRRAARSEPREKPDGISLDHFGGEIQVHPRTVGSAAPQDIRAGGVQLTVETENDRQQEPEETLDVQITRAFKDIPQTVDSTPILEQLRSDEGVATRSGARRPLSSRQPRATIQDQQMKKAWEDDPPAAILPRLVSRSETGSSQESKQADAEIELPPTPVQLGLSAAPDRPRGLASSSSGGSYSGSGKHRRRIRNGESRQITSSPLKPRNNTNLSHISPIMKQAQVRGTSREALESDTEQDTAAPQSEMSEEAKAKQIELAALEAQLDALRKDLEKLESLSENLNQDPNIQLDDEVWRLLIGNREKSSAHSNFVDMSPTSVKDNDAFMKLFAPGGLDLLHETEAHTDNGKHNVVHTLTISAPPAWPPPTLCLSFAVSVDIELSCIHSIMQKDSERMGSHSRLQQWIQQRLQEPLHRYDIGSLIFGAGQYFDACITRARTLRELHRRYSGSESLVNLAHGEGEAITRHEALSLSRYISTTQLALSAQNSSTTKHTTVKLLEKEVLITYDLQLSWTGVVKPKISISCTGIGVKAQKSAQELFQKLLSSSSSTGVVDAFDSVWKLLEFGDVGYNQGHVSGKASSKNARRGQRKVVAA